jgi:hypothetical protein
MKLIEDCDSNHLAESLPQGPPMAAVWRPQVPRLCDASKVLSDAFTADGKDPPNILTRHPSAAPTCRPGDGQTRHDSETQTLERRWPNAVTGPPPPQWAHALAAGRFGPKGSLDGHQPPNILRLTSTPDPLTAGLPQRLGLLRPPARRMSSVIGTRTITDAGEELRSFGGSPAAWYPPCGPRRFVRPPPWPHGEQRNRPPKGWRAPKGLPRRARLSPRGRRQRRAHRANLV